MLFFFSINGQLTPFYFLFLFFFVFSGCFFFVFFCSLFIFLVFKSTLKRRSGSKKRNSSCIASEPRGSRSTQRPSLPPSLRANRYSSIMYFCCIYTCHTFIQRSGLPLKNLQVPFTVVYTCKFTQRSGLPLKKLCLRVNAAGIRYCCTCSTYRDQGCRLRTSVDWGSITSFKRVLSCTCHQREESKMQKHNTHRHNAREKPNTPLCDIFCSFGYGTKKEYA